MLQWQVIWVDLLTKAEFEAGFGSHTPMFSGQTKCVRYYMNFGRALARLKEILLKVGVLHPVQCFAVSSVCPEQAPAASLREL